MKKTLLLGTFLVFACTLNAQKNLSNKVLWSINGLTWSDFKARPDKTLPYLSNLSYMIGYEMESVKLNDTIYKYIKPYCFVDPYSSWVHEEGKSNSNLIFNQTLFDLVELCRRKMQIDLNKGYSAIELPIRFNELIKENSVRFELFKEETSNGKNPGEVYRWANIVKEELVNTPSVYKPNSTMKIGKWRYAMFAGIDVGTFNGGTSAYFKSGAGINFGFDFARKKSQYTMDFSFVSGNRLKKDYIDEGVTRPKDLKLSTIFVQFTYGYALLDNARWRVAPYAGLGIAEASDRDSQKKENAFLIHSYRPIGGIGLDYKFKTIVNTVEASPLFFRNRGELIELAIKSRIGAMPIGFNNAVKGWGLVGSVSFCVSGFMVY